MLIILGQDASISECNFLSQIGRRISSVLVINFKMPTIVGILKIMTEQITCTLELRMNKKAS